MPQKNAQKQANNTAKGSIGTENTIDPKKARRSIVEKMILVWTDFQFAKIKAAEV